MKKALGIISISAGMVSVVSAVALGRIYLEDIAGHIKKAKIRFANKFHDKGC